MMVQGNKVFILGPGFVGREIIDLLRANGYDITTIVRRESAEQELKSDGITVVRGDLDDAPLIQKLASDSDVIFHTATADHLKSAQAILEGIRERVKQGKQTIYLHQSGASVLSDSSADQPSAKVFSDTDTDSINALPDGAPHRAIDLAILQGREEFGSLARIFIMMPPIIYGVNKKHGRLSIQVPILTRFALKHKYSGYVGQGKAIWGVIHVFDLAKAYISILQDLRKEKPTLDLANPYFFCESGEVSWYNLAVEIGRILHQHGKIDDPAPREVTPTDWADLFGSFTPDVLGCNARSKADRLRALGWKPVEPSIFEAYESEEIPVLLQENGVSSSG